MFNTFFCRSAKKDSIAALSPDEPTRPIDPRRPLFFSRRTTFFERNWLPRSEWTIVPAGDRNAIRLRNAGRPVENWTTVGWVVLGGFPRKVGA